jgi:hypothetical protein
MFYSLKEAAKKLHSPEVFGIGIAASKHWQTLDNWAMFFYTAGAATSMTAASAS